MIASFILRGSFTGFLENAVDSKADSVLFFIWFDMDVARSLLHGVGQIIDQTNNGGLLAGVLEGDMWAHLCLFDYFELLFPDLGKVFHHLAVPSAVRFRSISPPPS
ncbi:MAG: hypothetical protein MZV49_04840 [Rhodopseudomonas palustris]|nr:hypothetical protein [Rhodopseudomonas palustris]